MRKKSKKVNQLERISVKITNWVGTPNSIIAHTIFFVVIFALYFFGLTVDKILLILTTAVSLEAIYLAIFIQMTVNRNTQSLEEFGDDIEDIAEDVEDISEDIEDIQEDDREDELREAQTDTTMIHIQNGLNQLAKEIESLKRSRAA